jgi:hypothetical protein
MDEALRGLDADVFGVDDLATAVDGIDEDRGGAWAIQRRERPVVIDEAAVVVGSDDLAMVVDGSPIRSSRRSSSNTPAWSPTRSCCPTSPI